MKSEPARVSHARYTERVPFRCLGRCLGGWVAAGVLLAGTPALANGRYPNADQLVIDPGDASHLVLRATFGTLVSRDGGRRWSWICEEAVGYTGDPALAVLRGGSILTAFLGDIVYSTEEGCSIGRVPLTPERRYAVDVTLDPADTSRAWVLGSSLDTSRRTTVLDLDVSGATILPVANDFSPSTIEVAKSRPERIYVVGLDAASLATLLVSDDRGQSWQARAIRPYETSPMYISAVDPLDPDTLYIRVDDRFSDHLLVSRDAGQSFSDVLTLEAEMLGFALSPDGSRVAAGGPGAGVQVAQSADLQFRPGAPIASLRCLTWAPSGLFACAQESLDGWTLAQSTDDAQSFVPLWHVQDLVPLECAASTSTGALCPRAWLDIASRIGADLAPNATPPVEPAPKDSSCGLGWRAALRGSARGHTPSGSAFAIELLLAAILARRRSFRARQS